MSDIRVPTKIKVTHDEKSDDPIPIADREFMYPMGIYEATNKEELERYTDYVTGSHLRRYYQNRDEQGVAEQALKSCRILQEKTSFFLAPVTNYFLKESFAPLDFSFVFPDYSFPDTVYDWSVYRGSRINGYWDGDNRSDFLLTLDNTYDTPKWVFRWMIHPAMWVPNPLDEECHPQFGIYPTRDRVKNALKAIIPRWIQVPQTSSVNDNKGSYLNYTPICNIGSPFSSQTDLTRYKNFVVTNANWDYPITIPKLEVFNMCDSHKLIGLPDYTAQGLPDIPYYRVRTQDSWDRIVPELIGINDSPITFHEELTRTTRLKIEVLEYVPHPICVLLDALNRCDLSGTPWEGV